MANSSSNDTEKRRDDALRRALNTPPVKKAKTESDDKRKPGDTPVKKRRPEKE